MSATGRGKKREPNDFYATPPWPVHRLLEAVPLPGGIWLEPSAGDGAIMRAVLQVRQDVRWHAVEHGSATEERLVEVADKVWTGTNFLGWEPPRRYDVIVMNPPYTSALLHVQRALGMGLRVCALLRLNWLASDERAAWMRINTPDVYVLPDRPSFVGSGGDATDYAWMVWDHTLPGRIPCVRILASTPEAERRASRREPYAGVGQLPLFANV